MLRDIYENNKMRAKEMADYEKKFNKISNTTANTNEKVDKLGFALKSFINVMADVIGSKNDESSSKASENLRDLVSFLDKEEMENGTNMDYEENEQENERNNKRKPSPDTIAVLGGEANKI